MSLGLPLLSFFALTALCTASPPGSAGVPPAGVGWSPGPLSAAGKWQAAVMLGPLPVGLTEALQSGAFSGQSQAGQAGRLPYVAKGRLQIGIGREFESPIVLSAATVRPDEWTRLPSGWRVWSAEVISEGAVGIRLHLESVSLPEGVRVLVYDPDKPESAPRPITAQTLAGEGEVWAQSVLAQRVVLECQAPAQVNLSAISLSISGVSHLYLSPIAKQMAGSCENDVSCFTRWLPQAAGVARISFVDQGNSYRCSGSVLADSTGMSAVAAGSVNYFLTANHCVANQKTASTIEFDWLYQSSSCNAGAPTTWPTTAGGAAFLAGADGNSGSDFGFMRLRETPPEGVNRLPWSRTAPTTSESLTCIHHPTGDYTRISFGRLVNGDPLQLGPDFWTVQWSSGVTEEGSSGSPLFDADQQIIGQLYGGDSACDNPNGNDAFGRFDLTYAAIKRWVQLQGTYYGLFQDSAGPAQQSSGAFTLTTLGTGKFSGSLQMGSARYPLSGQLDDSGSARILVSRHNGTPLLGHDLAPLTVTLNVDLTGGSDQVSGTVSSTNENWTARLVGNRAVFDGRYSIAPQAGRYTLVVPGTADSQTLPDGNSYATLTVDKAGHITFAAGLADGTRVSQSSELSRNGLCPLYVPLYSGQGSLLSWVTITSSTGALSGEVSWIKPILPKATYYGAGFTNQTALSGSFYDKKQPLLGFDTGNATLSGGGLAADIVNAFRVDAAGTVTNLSSTNKFSLTFNASSGLFSGSVSDPASAKPVRYGGVVLQNQGTGAGAFLGAALSGSVELQRTQ